MLDFSIKNHLTEFKKAFSATAAQISRFGLRMIWPRAAERAQKKSQAGCIKIKTVNVDSREIEFPHRETYA